ncbi:MAG TPA: R3H domain-containing nucleic acid-binding protein [Patescibacteria group bacterium]|nr:R3H domain-containing nucleic acid-binding protein [Patescibacteria group bacterium]
MAEAAVNEQAVVEEVTQELLGQLEVVGEPAVTMHEDMAEIVLETEESGLIIGYHGEILEALQLILSLIASRRIGRFVRISVEVGDYKKNRTDYLERLARETKEKVLTEDRPHTLSALKSWERRIIHLVLQEDEDVTSESMGEGKDRVLVIKPRD